MEVPGLGACKKLADNRGPCCQPTLCSWAGAWQRLGRSLEVPGLGRAGQMLQVLGWRFWEDLVRCWPNVFNLGALPVPCQDRFLGFPLGRHFGPFLAPFWLHFGTILGTKWPKKAIPKSTEKKVRKKSCDCSQVSASLGAAVPLKPSNWRVGGSFNTLQSLHWCLGGTVAD